jgi:two-component system LytT family response regulator
MSRVRVVVVDDEALARERVVALVRDAPELELVGEASHGLEALDLIASAAPDLVFLDVEMPELSGFDVAAALESATMPGLVFITAYEEYAMKAFEVDAIDYLQKPVTPERFDAAVRRALWRLKSGADSRASVVQAIALRGRESARYRTRFVVRRGSTHTFVAASDVAWINGVDNYLQLHAGGRSHLVRGTMKDAERELDPTSFLRIHRSTIVNITHIASIDAQATGGYVVRMSDGAKLRTSRQYASRVRVLVAPRTR